MGLARKKTEKKRRGKGILGLTGKARGNSNPEKRKATKTKPVGF